MKVKTINRSEEAFTRERAQDVQKVHHNLDPALHPFEKAVEYTRALKAGKSHYWESNRDFNSNSSLSPAALLVFFLSY